MSKADVKAILEDSIDIMEWEFINVPWLFHRNSTLLLYDTSMEVVLMDFNLLLILIVVGLSIISVLIDYHKDHGNFLDNDLNALGVQSLLLS